MSDKEYFCTDCGSSYRFGGGDLQYEVTNILCPSCSDEHIASLITRLAAAEKVVDAVKAWKKANWPDGIDEAWEDIGKALAEYDKVKS